jgi:hypothetical protein
MDTINGLVPSADQGRGPSAYGGSSASVGGFELTMSDERDLRRDPRHLAATHERWLARRNRKQEEPSYRDEWWAQQCGMCRFWIALQPPLGSDKKSEFDGRVQFEHDGCDHFEQAKEWGQAEQSL